MDTLDGIDRLVRRAREERIPSFGVADQVMLEIRSGETLKVSFAAFDFFAGIFAAATSIVFYIGVNAWMHIMSPLTQFFAPLQEVRLW